MLDLVPLAGPRGVMAYRDRNSDRIDKFLQMKLPPARTVAIAASRIGTNQ